MDKNFLGQFAQKKDKGLVQEFYNKALDILTRALTDMNSKGDTNSNILQEISTRIFPMGDYTNDTFIDQTGELEIVVASSNPQLIITNKLFSKSFHSTNSNKQKKLISSDGTYDKIIPQIVKCLQPYFSEETTLLVINDGIKIFCNEEFGFKILIRFATYSADDEDAILDFWEFFSKKSTSVNLFLYNENLEKKDAETNGNYKKLVRIFKNIRKNILLNKWTSAASLNKYFIELICYNIPNSLMQDSDINIMFYKVVNYLDNCDITRFLSFDGMKLSSFYFAKVSYDSVFNFTKYLLKISNI